MAGVYKIKDGAFERKIVFSNIESFCLCDDNATGTRTISVQVLMVSGTRYGLSCETLEGAQAIMTELEAGVGG